MSNMSISHYQGTARPIPTSPRTVSAFGCFEALSAAAPGGGRAKRALAAPGLAKELSVLGWHELPTGPRALQGHRVCGDRGQQEPGGDRPGHSTEQAPRQALPLGGAARSEGKPKKSRAAPPTISQADPS